MASDLHKLWLIFEKSDHDLWLKANNTFHYNLFASFLLFNSLSFVTGKLVAGRINAPKLIAQAKFGISQFFHATAAVSAAVYILTNRQTPLDSGCDPTRIFCFDTLTFLFLDIHAGYLFYEWIFFLFNDAILKPRFEFLGVQRTLLLIMYALARVHPCTLTKVILPFYQLLAVAQAAEARLDLAVALGSPSRICLDRLWYLVILSLFRAAGALAISFYSWWWISSNHLMHVDLPRGKRIALNTAYCYVVVGGGFSLALLYVNWFRAAADSQKRTYAVLKRAKDKGNAEQTAVMEAVKASSGRAKKKKMTTRA
jgi:hypothetical protein